MADPDLQIRGGGRGGWSPKNVFWSFGPQFGLKIRGGQAPQAPPLDLPLVCLSHGVHGGPSWSKQSIFLAQLFEGRLALNPGLNLTLVSFSCV